RDCIPEKYSKYAGMLALCLVGVLLSTNFASIGAVLNLEFTTNREPIALERARDLLALSIPTIALVVLAWYGSLRKGNVSLMLTSVVVFASALLVAPYAYRNWTSSGYEEAYASFAGWRAAIDHRRSVFWAQDPLAVWYLLESPS